MEQSTDPESAASLPVYFQRSQSTDGTRTLGRHAPMRSLLMTHSSTLPTITRASSFVNASFQRRSVQLRDNFHHVVREIQPLVETAGNVTRFLNRPTSEPNIQTASESSTSTSNHDNTSLSNHVVNIDVPNNAPAAISEENVIEEVPPTDEAENAQHANMEAQEILGLIAKYLPFMFLIIIKCMYDHQDGILNTILLFAIFANANSVVKKEATKRERRNVTKLLLAAVYIGIGIFFIYYIFDDQMLYMSLIFIQDYKVPMNEWDLLWYVGITDFVLKLITIAVKIVFTLLPGFIVAFQKRGKIYLFMESFSQFYRSLATTPPWLKYLLDSYQGTGKMVGVLLCAAYFVSKGAYLWSKMQMLHRATLKLLQNVAIGSSPSKEQVQTAGEHCPICHDDYEKPVLLQCRHIFCENCVTTWFDREQTCPLCRSKIVDDPSWRDGSTTFFLQLF
ncbi:RING finger and transmembrane domain-containing protein 2 [Atheta coriaria]|uniref:RING finger and transmembrane domain-containing protein 2 n=1 Tax=Dalotia coriaria TaxID=877792 RepID=UPI0031F34A8A